MTSEKRQQRVRGLLVEELAILIGSELEDPKLSFVTVTDVVVSKDLHNVRVYVNHQDENVSKREVLSRLEKAAPFVRGKISERLTMRSVPEITFEYDESALPRGAPDRTAWPDCCRTGRGRRGIRLRPPPRKLLQMQAVKTHDSSRVDRRRCRLRSVAWWSATSSLMVMPSAACSRWDSSLRHLARSPC